MSRTWPATAYYFAACLQAALCYPRGREGVGERPPAELAGECPPAKLARKGLKKTSQLYKILVLPYTLQENKSRSHSLGSSTASMSQGLLAVDGGVAGQRVLRSVQETRSSARLSTILLKQLWKAHDI